MKVAIVKYNAGNIRSVINAVKRLGVDPIYTDEADVLRNADRVIFPGQGEASTAMAYLQEHGLVDVIRSLRQPVLGICIGQQLLCRHSVVGNKAHSSEGSRSEDAHPGNGFCTNMGLESKVQHDSNTNSQQRKNELSEGQSEEH